MAVLPLLSGLRQSPFTELLLAFSLKQNYLIIKEGCSDSQAILLFVQPKDVPKNFFGISPNPSKYALQADRIPLFMEHEMEILFSRRVS